jgi:hypothetical protein
MVVVEDLVKSGTGSNNLKALREEAEFHRTEANKYGRYGKYADKEKNKHHLSEYKDRLNAIRNIKNGIKPGEKVKPTNTRVFGQKWATSAFDRMDKSFNIQFSGDASERAQKRIKHYISNIESYHDLPDDKVLVHIVPSKQLKKEGVRAKFDSDKKMFIVDPKGTSFQHEMGHYIDRFVLGKEGKPWSENNANYRKQFGFRKRPRNKTEYVRYFDPLRNVTGWYTPRDDDDNSDTTMEYARSQPKEHFASAYNKVLGEQDRGEHRIRTKDVDKFKKVLYNKLLDANIQMRRALKDMDINQI